MKKLLVIHNSYRNVGGEDIAVNNELSLLDKHFEIKKLIFSNQIKSPYKQSFYFLINKNFESSKKLQNIINEFKPDYAYVHNTWFKASTNIFKILERNNIKTLVKLHNFRFDCTKSFLSSKHLNGDDRCGACGFSKRGSGNFNKYYEDSYLKSLIVNTYGRKYFKILKNKDIKILTLTEFHREYLENLGFNKQKIFVHRNFIDADKKNFNYNSKSDYIVYAGRISEEKGVEDLIKSYLSLKDLTYKLKIVGNGPAYRYLKEKYMSIEFLGEVENESSKEIIRNSRAVVTATGLFEGQPTLLCEASTLGVPSVFPRNGGIGEFFEADYKLSFESGNKDDLKSKLTLLNSSEILNTISSTNYQYLNNLLNEHDYISNFERILNE